MYSRCLALGDHLDDCEHALLRTREHFEAALCNTPSAKDLWNSYGIIAGLKVRSLPVLSVAVG